jgi:Flp pilus assembly protein TadD
MRAAAATLLLAVATVPLVGCRVFRAEVGIGPTIGVTVKVPAIAHVGAQYSECEHYGYNYSDGWRAGRTGGESGASADYEYTLGFLHASGSGKYLGYDIVARSESEHFCALVPVLFDRKKAESYGFEIAIGLFLFDIRLGFNPWYFFYDDHWHAVRAQPKPARDESGPPEPAAAPDGDGGLDEEQLAEVSRQVGLEMAVEERARRLLTDGDFEGALAAANEGLAELPRSAPLLTVKGDVLLQMFRFEEAVVAFEQAREHLVVWADHPEPAWAVCYGKGLALLRLQRFAEAEQALRTALDWMPDAKTHFALANALSSQGQVRAAIAELDRAIELAPDYGSAYGTRALYRAGLGDEEGAIADYLEVKERAPHLLPIVEMGLTKLGVEVPR